MATSHSALTPRSINRADDAHRKRTATEAMEEAAPAAKRRLGAYLSSSTPNHKASNSTAQTNDGDSPPAARLCGLIGGAASKKRVAELQAKARSVTGTGPIRAGKRPCLTPSRASRTAAGQRTHMFRRWEEPQSDDDISEAEQQDVGQPAPVAPIAPGPGSVLAATTPAAAGGDNSAPIPNAASQGPVLDSAGADAVAAAARPTTTQELDQSRLPVGNAAAAADAAEGSVAPTQAAALAAEQQVTASLPQQQQPAGRELGHAGLQGSSTASAANALAPPILGPGGTSTLPGHNAGRTTQHTSAAGGPQAPAAAPLPSMPAVTAPDSGAATTSTPVAGSVVQAPHNQAAGHSRSFAFGGSSSQGTPAATTTQGAGFSFGACSTPASGTAGTGAGFSFGAKEGSAAHSSQSQAATASKPPAGMCGVPTSTMFSSGTQAGTSGTSAPSFAVQSGAAAANSNPGAGWGFGLQPASAPAGKGTQVAAMSGAPSMGNHAAGSTTAVGTQGTSNSSMAGFAFSAAAAGGSGSAAGAKFSFGAGQSSTTQGGISFGVAAPLTGTGAHSSSNMPAQLSGAMFASGHTPVPGFNSGTSRSLAPNNSAALGPSAGGITSNSAGLTFAALGPSAAANVPPVSFGNTQSFGAAFGVVSDAGQAGQAPIGPQPGTFAGAPAASNTALFNLGAAAANTGTGGGPVGRRRARYGRK